jgi:hypothetical protein
MKPLIHAKNSVRAHGGHIADYLPIHDFIDSSKSVVADMRHRAILHSAFGIYLVERCFGDTMTNSDGNVLSVRDIAEEHVIEDLGRIPSMQDYLDHMELAPWMSGARTTTRFIPID